LAERAEASGGPLNVDQLDQHLLIDDTAIGVLLEAAELTPQTTVLEIGAGPGAITTCLAKLVRHVDVIELDGRFRQFLDPLVSEFGNVAVIFGDARTVPYPDVDIVVANPPFSIIEDLVRRLAQSSIKVATLVLGTSTARALTAPPGSSDFSRLSLQAQAAFSVRTVARISPSAFHPPARTSGCIVVLTRADDKRWPLRPLADAMWQQASKRVADVVWFLTSPRANPPSEAVASAFKREARSSRVLRPILQRRLQELSRDQISTMAAEFIAIADRVAVGGPSSGDGRA
jgi:Dimethyladenosine transferase (rRNA methylation)